MRYLAVLLLAASLAADVLRVPQEYPTIQEALDGLAATDTVLISRGVYEEALIAPPRRFALIGVFEQDSAAPRPIVDATDVAGVDTMAALTLPESSFVSIENLCFRNWERNGITTLADTTELTNCVVESTEVGLIQAIPFVGKVLIVTGCRFRACSRRCVNGRGGNYLFATRSVFLGDVENEGLALVLGGNAVLSMCTFSKLVEGTLLIAANSEITDCVFGPTRGQQFTGTIALDGPIVRFNGNLVVGCENGARALVVGSSTPDSIEIRENIFRNCRGVLGNEGTIGFVIYPDDTNLGPLISGNRFENCSGYIYCDDISPSSGTPVRIENNWFIHDSVNGLPAIGGAWPWLETPITLRNNVFINCGYALHGSPATDAAFNYWGDASGPYHELNNPGGLGDTVTGPVSFVPWLEDTVTNAIARPELIPDWAVVAVYPNPFNGDFEIVISGQPFDDFSVRLFDLLGRQVALLHEGVVQNSVLHVTAPRHLASGVYFVSARDGENSVVQRVVLLK